MPAPLARNLTEDRPTFVTHLECSATGERHAADVLHGLSAAGKPLLVRYDLEALAGSVTKDQLGARPPDMWRYREFLPVRRTEHLVSLGEAMTPLVSLSTLAATVGINGEILVKDEGRLPTGSFKARGLALAVSMAKELGVHRLAMPTNGNAGAALAAYGSRAGLETYVFCPEDTPEVNVREIALQGGQVWRVNGLIDDCGRIVADGKGEMGWFDVSTLKEPYRIEGKKTMGLELAEQLGWPLPDVILYPTGGGTGLIGMWKAFDELRELGWLDDTTMPRMIACQAAGCAPIVRAFEAGERFAEPFPDPETSASGLRVPSAVGDFMILDAVRASGGSARAAAETDLLEWTRRAAALEGISFAPETGACLAVLAELATTGDIGADEQVVVFNTGAATKYVEALRSPLPRWDPATDWGTLA